MGDQPFKRRLAAILAADVAGYTRLMEQDTDGTVAAWQAARDAVITAFTGQVRSCVRPVNAVICPAGLDGFRGSGPTAPLCRPLVLDVPMSAIPSRTEPRILRSGIGGESGLRSKVAH